MRYHWHLPSPLVHSGAVHSLTSLISLPSYSYCPNHQSAVQQLSSNKQARGYLVRWSRNWVWRSLSWRRSSFMRQVPKQYTLLSRSSRRPSAMMPARHNHRGQSCASTLLCPPQSDWLQVADACVLWRRASPGPGSCRQRGCIPAWIMSCTAG